MRALFLSGSPPYSRAMAQVGPFVWLYTAIATSALVVGSLHIDRLEENKKRNKEIEREQFAHMDYCKQNGLPMPEFKNPWA